MDVKTKGNGGLASFLGKRKTKRMIFFACLVILPIIQFSICYIYVNINSFVFFGLLSHINNRKNNTQETYRWTYYCRNTAKNQREKNAQSYKI